MNAILIRHTRIDLPPGTCYGRFDVPLSATFPEEATAVLERLPWRPVEVRSSPASRCRRLAELIAGNSGCGCEIDERLAELHMGAWEGRSWDELSGPEFEAWKRDPWHTRPPGGETPDEFVARVAALRAELQAFAVQGLVLVTHAGVIRAWRTVSEQRPLQDLFEERIDFGSIWPAR